MPKIAMPAGRIRFGLFEVDLKSQELFKEGARIALANQTFIALATLLERPGELVSREELRRRLWPDGRMVEFDQGLHAIINRLREALGEGPEGAGLIETLPRRGYRFIGTLSTPRSNHARGRSVGLALAAVAIIGIAVWVAARWYSHPLPAPAEEAMRLTPITSLVGREAAPAVQRRGTRLLFAWDGGTDGRRFDVYARRLDSERLERLTHDAALALQGAWAPDGEQIALARQDEQGGGVYLLAASGGAERRLVSANFLSAPFLQLSWSPDGRRIAYAAVESDGWSHIETVDTQGARALVAKPADCNDAVLPDFSPNGRWLTFVCTQSVAVYRVYLMDLASGDTRSLFTLQGNPQGLAFTPSSDAMIVANESGDQSALWRIALNGNAVRLYRAEGPLGPGIAVTGEGIAFVRQSDLIDIARVDLAAPAAASENPVSSTHSQLVPVYSPDGAHIAFESTRSGTSEIWLADANGQNPVKLTAFNGPLTGAPSFCQDGRRLAFDSRSSGSSAIYLLDVFEGRPQRLETSTPNLSLPVWSPDCRWIIASNGRNALYRVPASGGAAEPLTRQRAYRAVVAGDQVIFNVVSENGVQLWVKPLEGGGEAPVALPPLRYADSWTATPGHIYFTTKTAQGSALAVYDFSTHATRVLRSLEGTPADLGGLGMSVSQNERWVLYSRYQRLESDILMLKADRPAGGVAAPK